jgi:predicted 3-demethylubiquinone-9 3-methyltransferase (glyoxalase superfamily)
MSGFTTSFLMNDNALELAEFYVGIFPDSHIVNVSRQDENTVFVVDFVLRGDSFNAINSGASFEFSHALSLTIHCADQTEVDYYWDRLVDGGTPGRCGWLQDRFGVSWQVVPTALGSYLGDPNPARAAAAMSAMMQMSKLDLAAFAAAVAEISG